MCALPLRAALFVATMFAGGCQLFPKTSTVSSKSDWEHNNLYNHRSPYARMHVEIDAVEGQGPTKDELRALEEFLKRYCDKPAGITIKVDSIIPKHTAAGRSAESLALEFMSGPSEPDSAYLYMIFYHARLRGKEVETENPSYSPLPHPIVFIDRSYHMKGNPYGRTFRRAVLLHETGHALGLCATSNHHAEGGHCTNERCRMNPAINFNVIHFFTLRNPWTNTELCADCIAQLEQNKATPPTRTVDFWRGYFRRSERGYQVLGVPGLNYVHFGEPLAEPNEELIKTRRQLTADIASGTYSFWATAESFDPWQHMEAFTLFTQEKDEPLRGLAKDLFEKIFALLDERAETHADDVMPLLSDEFIATAREFPEQQALLISLREELSASAGYGAALTRQPRKKEAESETGETTTGS